MRRPFSLLCIGLANILAAQPTSFEHIFQIDAYSVCRDIYIDPLTGINLSVGDFSNSITIGDTTSYSNGQEDAFIVALDSGNNILWRKTFGAEFDDKAWSVIGNDNFLIIAGQFRGTVNFFGDTTVTSSFYDMVVMKLDKLNGDLIWLKTIEASGGSSVIPKGLSSDENGNTYIAGSFNGIINLPDTSLNSLNGPALIAKINSSGSWEWVNSFGGNYTSLVDINYDGQGNLSVCGVTHLPTDFDSLYVTTTYEWFFAGYIAKFTTDGMITTVNLIEGPGPTITALTNDNEGNIYVCGEMFGCGLYFDGFLVPCNGGAYSANAFIAKYNSAANLVWVSTTYGRALPLDIAVNNFGEVIVGGWFQNTIGFLCNYSSATGFQYPHFLASLNKENGNWLWDLPLVANAGEIMNIGVDNNSGIYFNGSIHGESVFTPFNFSPTGEVASVVGKLKTVSCNTPWYTDLDGDGHGNSIAEVNSCIQPCGLIGNGDDCDDGNPLIGSSLFTITIENVGELIGCRNDTVQLFTSIDDLDYLYQWKRNGVNIPGQTTSMYKTTRPGFYQLYISTGICESTSDSVEIVKNPLPSANITNLDAETDLCFDPSIRLRANGGAGNSWQWYKDGVLIPGATSRTYFATSVGSYQVEVTNAFGCSKFSSSIVIINSCKLSVAEDELINVYPNPNFGEFVVDISKLEINEEITFILRNITGEITAIRSLKESSDEINIQGLTSGIYILELAYGTKRKYFKIVVIG